MEDVRQRPPRRHRGADRGRDAEGLATIRTPQRRSGGSALEGDILGGRPGGETPKVLFYRRGRRGDPELVGLALYWRGRVIFVGDVAPGRRLYSCYRVDATRVFDRGRPPDRPDDGLAYLEALPRTFHGSYFWAEATWPLPPARIGERPDG